MNTVLLYLAIYALAEVPGLRPGFVLFGRRHAAGWIAGALFGYMLTSLAIWAVIYAGVPSRLAFAIAWFAITVIAWIAAPAVVRPVVELPQWSRRDTGALLVVWILTLAIAVPPFVRAGEIDGSGNQRYRAYF